MCGCFRGDGGGGEGGGDGDEDRGGGIIRCCDWAKALGMGVIGRRAVLLVLEVLQTQSRVPELWGRGIWHYGTLCKAEEVYVEAREKI